jgi:hypothetical protein
MALNKLIAVEGKDEVNFFNCLLKDMGFDNYAVEDVGGTRGFNDYFPALVQSSNFSDVDTIIVIRDADESAEKVFESIKNVLIKAHLEPPKEINYFSNGNPRVGVFIMPGDSEKGMLEDLCLRTVKDHPVMEFIDAFVKFVLKLEKPPKNIAKSKAQVFLAAMPEIVCSVGLGAAKGYWNFNSEELITLKSFLTYLRKEI